jgi:MFS transporter, FHS family, L-fucose permease
VIGGGIFPVLFGGLIDRNPLNPQTAILLLIPCYLVLLFFASYGYRIQSWRVTGVKELQAIKV